MLKRGPINEILKQNSNLSTGNIIIHSHDVLGFGRNIAVDYMPHMITLTGDTHATVLQNLKQHIRKNDQGM
jgi:hypothetical protein